MLQYTFTGTEELRKRPQRKRRFIDKTTKCINENKANMATTISGSFAHTHHDAPFVNVYAVQVELFRNGICPYHADIQLRNAIMNE